MSVDYTAYTVIGIKIPEKDIIVERRTRGCKHEETKSKHCPECGKEMWIIEKNYAPEYEKGNDKFMDLDLVTEGTDGEDLYIGKAYKTGASWDNNDRAVFNKIPEIETIKNEIKIKLGKYWNEKQFGIYTVLYCSY